MSGVSKRVYSSRRNVDIGGGVDKAGLPGSVGIPSMLRRFIAKRAPDGIKNAVEAVDEVVKEYIYVAIDDNKVYKFDGTSWNSVVSMATHREWHGVAVYSGLLYAVGGQDSGGGVSSVERYDGSAWSSAPAMATARYLHGVVAYNGLLYAVGGRTTGGVTLSSVEVFNGEEWTFTTPFTQNIYGMGIAIYDK